MAGTNTIRQAIDQHSSHFLVVVFQVAGRRRFDDRVPSSLSEAKQAPA
jgi:hypothetical protein